MLSVRQAAQNFQAGVFAPAFLFFGEEDYLREELQRLLVKTFLGEESGFGLEKVEGAAAPLEEALAQLAGANLFAPRQVLVVKNSPHLAPPRGKAAEAAAAAEEEAPPEPAEPAGQTRLDPAEAACAALWRFIETEKARPSPERIVIFQAAAVDRRKKMFKLLAKHGLAVECAPYKGDELARWIQTRAARAGKKIERAAVEQLLMAGGGMWHLAGELDKYIAYLNDDETVITAAVVEQLYSGDSQANVFALADSLSEGDLQGALAILQHLLSRREEPVRIFFMLVRHYRLLIIARSLLDERIPPAEHAAALQVPPFAVRRLLQQASLYSSEILADALPVLQQIDRQIKTGALEPRLALEITLGKLGHLTRSMK
ncbi:MAG: DNA polymerase III subunit delta [Bacillota bacterium]